MAWSARAMGSRGCSVGCLGSLSLFCLLVLFTGGGPFGVNAFFLGMAAMFGLLAWVNIRRGMAETAAAREAVRGIHEKRILEIAARHGGLVTPALVAMEAQGLTIKTAKAMLEELARDGYCTVDSDEDGHVHFRFPLGQERMAGETALSAEEWVERMSGR